MDPLRGVRTSVILGWAGVGKTRLVHALVAHRPASERWAVLLNQPGDTTLDEAVAAARGGLAVGQVGGGCACCVAGPAFQVALRDLLAAHRPHRLIVEPSGLAAPGALLGQLRQPWLRDTLDLRATLTVVDPQAFLEPGSLRPAVWHEQLEAADLVVRAAEPGTPEALAALHAWAERANPRPPVEAWAADGVDPAWLDLPPLGRRPRFRPLPARG